MIFLHKNLEFIIKNDLSDKMIKAVKDYIPEWVTTSKKGKHSFNVEMAEEILYGELASNYIDGNSQQVSWWTS